MPRSFSFEHFTVGKTQPSRSLRERDKQRLHETEAPGRRPYGIHYGKSHAETEELLREHREHPLEELPRMEREREPAQETQRAEEVLRSIAGRLPPPGAVPIGAIPVIEEPPPASALSEVIGDGERYLATMLGAARDFVRAGRHLLGLPVEFARVLARSIRPARQPM